MAILIFFFGGLFIVGFILQTILWGISIYQALTRKDLSTIEEGALWMIPIIFFGTLGSVAFFFYEKRKKLGHWCLWSLVGTFISFFIVLAVRSV
ncbi:MAG TPA: hypothetical protein DDW36_02715 [Candidatus Magasanikbacteria bacterium]|nr:hypothetical protein [Candidatus Magasanikbacteria bacterium]